MESFKTWLNDKKNQPIIIGVLVGVVVLVAVAWFLMGRSSGGDTTTASAPSDSTSAPAGLPGGAPTAPGAPGAAPGAPGAEPSAPGAPGATPGPGAAPAPAAAPGAAPGAAPMATPEAAAPAAASGAAGAAGAAGAKAGAKQAPLEEYRADPFRPYFGAKPRRTKLAFTAKLPKPEIRKIAPVIVDQAAQRETLPPQPVRRMAGLLKNGRVYAIIESGGATTIVKAGDQLDENVAVDTILPDKVILRSTKTKHPIFVEVPKAAGQAVRREPRQPAATPEAPGRAGRGGRMPSMPGAPGAMPPPMP